MTTSAPDTVLITTSAPRRPSHPHSGRRGRFEPYVLIAPTVLLVLGLMVIPIIIVIVYSLFDNVVTNQNPQFVGFANYVTILTDPNFWNAVSNTLIFTVASVVIHMIIGVAFALMLNSKLVHALPGRSSARSTSCRGSSRHPWSPSCGGCCLDPSGVINYVLTTLGALQEAVPWLATPATALLAVTVINIWSGYPFFMISLLAGLQGVPTDLYEAARVDGAGLIRQFFSVTLPALRPVLYSMALLDLLWTTQQFTLIWATTGGGPINHTEVVSTYTYKLAFNSYQFSLASTSAVVILVASLFVAIFYVRQQKKASQF
ncbi:carbohydrate ABC transporter permease [Microbacterium elymi]|uniref:Sugar ABC transporter permease n=1 Tax=Microbacterium elymi TaxID=2909587 RepID=A0ABY5NMK4_9MICO|nr:sugar ABC transporter permease [Microbacterium elymi]UUT36425.1 sugar ABC transporter permease [Microbacterium elymi]